MAKTTFKVGDKVRINNDNRYAHVKIGDIATVTSIEEYPNGGNGYMLRNGPETLREHDSNSTGFHFFFYEGQFESVKENYNLDQMYPWHGGECPVHPESKVRYWMRLGNYDGYESKAKNLRWNNSSRSFTNDIVAFKVTKEYVEPARPAASKAIWVNEYADGEHMAFETEADARARVGNGKTRIAVKYVEAITDAKDVWE